MEPNLPSLSERVRTFIKLSSLLGKERVIWRFDPLLLSNAITVESLAARIERLGEMLCRHTTRLVVSFVDISAYAKVRRNLGKRPQGPCEFTVVSCPVANHEH